VSPLLALITAGYLLDLAFALRALYHGRGTVRDLLFTYVLSIAALYLATVSAIACSLCAGGVPVVVPRAETPLCENPRAWLALGFLSTVSFFAKTLSTQVSLKRLLRP
jgi:hypothetical protein